MEQLIAVLVFALCAAVCVNVFVASQAMALNARDSQYALLLAESAAEYFKTDTRTDAAGRETSFYSEDGVPCGRDEAYFILRVMAETRSGAPETLVFAQINVEKTDGSPLVCLTAAARKAG